jgi:dihydropteroate synthase
MKLRLREREIDIQPGPPLLMGIVNASPESFSDGGAVGTLDTQVTRALELIEQGAELIDVGGESGVTGEAALEPREEAARVVPLVERLVAEGVTVSVDTWKPEVARAVVAAGAAMINDVSGLRDPALADACAESGAALVLTHTRAEPKVKGFPVYDDVVADVREFLRERMDIAIGRGVRPEQIVLDPGPDFAKTPAQTVAVLRSLDALRELGRPLLLAVSRKDFVGALTGRPPRERLAGTLAAVAAGVQAGAAILRVHDVREVRDYLTVAAVLRGERQVPDDLALAEELRREPA